MSTITTPDTYISYFTPSEMSHETLEFILVKRERLVERLVERVRHSALTEAKPQSILLGPRGIGKSFLVSLVYHRVKAETDLADKLIIGLLPEDEWGVASLVDLYMVILEALEKEYGGIRQRIDSLYNVPLGDRTDTARDLIRTVADGRTLFLLIENLEEIFRGLTDDELWSFRSFLSENPFITILATNYSLFAGIDRQTDAFFGFFEPMYLNELNVKEATALLGKLAARRNDTQLQAFLKTPTAQDRVQAVHDLAGGHPRLYLLFAHLLTQSRLDELVTSFLEFLDELTPYFQDRMKTLSPQQQKIVTFLSDRRGAVAVKDIVSRTNGLTSQTISGQLDKLEEMGYVRKTKVGRESHYELREPMLRMVIEKKRGRGEPIRLVVDFLRRWYSRNERHNRLQNTPPNAIMTRHYWEASLDVDRAWQDTPDPRRAEELSPEFWNAYQTQSFDQAAEIAAEIIDRKGRASSIIDWFLYASCLMELGKNEQEIKYLNRILEIDPNNTSALNNIACSLVALGEINEAIVTLSKAIEINSKDIDLWINKGRALQYYGRFDEALECFNKAISIDPDDADLWFIRSQIFLSLNQVFEFIEALKHSFSIVQSSSINYFEGFDTNSREYCRILIVNKSNSTDFMMQMTAVFMQYHALDQLSQGLTESIPALFEPEITNERANFWLAAWTAAAEGKPDLTVPLRLLKAAVEWKPKRDVRALLQLAIEERRILEQLLPKDAETTKQ